MNIDPMVVAIGAVLCLLPVGFGILIANWKLPWIERKPLVLDDFDMRPGQINCVDEKTWPQHEMRDEGDIACDCASCEFWGRGGFFQ